MFHHKKSHETLRAPRAGQMMDISHWKVGDLTNGWAGNCGYVFLRQNLNFPPNHSLDRRNSSEGNVRNTLNYVLSKNRKLSCDGFFFIGPQTPKTQCANGHFSSFVLGRKQRLIQWGLGHLGAFEVLYLVLGRFTGDDR